MKISEKWNDIESKDFSENNILSLGGHICKILDVSDYISENNKPCVRVVFDIEEGSKYDGYCQKLLNSRTTDDKRWPNEGTKYIPTSYQGYFKHFVDVLQKSNNIFLNITPGKDVDFNQFKGLKFAGVFGLQEYKNSNDEIKTSMTLTSFQEIGKVNEITIPDVRLLDGSYIIYEEYMKNKKSVEKQGPIQEKINFQENSSEIPEMGIEDSEYPF